MNKNEYHLNLGATEACTTRMMEETKGIYHRDVKGSTKDFFLAVGLPQIRCYKLKWVLVKTLLVCLNAIQSYYARISLRH